VPQREETFLPEVRGNKKGFGDGSCRVSLKPGKKCSSVRRTEQFISGAFACFPMQEDNAYGLLSKSSQVVFCDYLVSVVPKMCQVVFFDT